MTYTNILNLLKETNEFLKTADGGDVLQKRMEKLVKFYEDNKDRKKMDVKDLKRFRVKEESDRKREVVSMGMEDVDVPTPPPTAIPVAIPVATPVPPTAPLGQCECRVASGTRLIPGRCKTKAKHEEIDQDGNVKLVCGRHKNAIDTCMKKYDGWTRSRGHLYGWFVEGDETWRQRLSPHLNPFYKPPTRKPKRKQSGNIPYRGVVRGIATPTQ